MAHAEYASLKAVRRFLLPASAFTIVWLLLTEGNWSALPIGIPAVLAAAWVAVRTRSASRPGISLPGLMRFMPLFLWESLRGGFDVARRTLSPELRIQPGFTCFRTGLGDDNARVFLTNCICLLPGSLAADLQGDRIDIHLLDAAQQPEAELHRLEKAVGRLFVTAPDHPGKSAPC